MSAIPGDASTRTSSDALGSPDIVLVRYGELSLKGGNRREFEQTLVRNIKAAVAPIADVRIERVQGRLVLFPSRRPQAVAKRVQDVFGITSLSPAWGVRSEPDAIVALARLVLEDALSQLPARSADDTRLPTVRVRTKRADKRFPMHSYELDAYVAERVLDAGRHVVRLKDPEVTLGIDVRSERTYVFAHRLPGPGGLPVGTLGRSLCLLSGGIDSPVAAYMTMKRGSRVDFCSFHSYPYLGEGSRKKVVDLVRALARYQPRSRLHSVPFTAIQEAIRDGAPEPFRTLLYRRMMQRIAARIAHRVKAGALVTGECLGQVASQTLENLACIGAATDRLVLRPLIGFDKEETIRIARRIGTFDISALPEPDCCTVFQPSKPVLRARVEECEAAEAGLDVDELVAAAVRGTERIDVAP